MSSPIAAVQSEAILKELAHVWRGLSKDSANNQQQTAVLRACAMTFLVAMEESDDAQAVGEALALLMHEHPSRAIVLRLRDTAEEVLEARVLAQCWMPFGSREQICSEQIEITSSRSGLSDVPAAVMGLIVPDLPVVLWCRHPRLLELAEFQRVLPLANKIIIDSSAGDKGLQTIGRLWAMRSKQQRVADLAWARLTPWRETIARLFEGLGPRRNLSAYQSVTITHRPGAVPPEALYIQAWFRNALPPTVSVTLQAAEKDNGVAVRRVSLQGEGCTIAVEYHAQSTVEVELVGVSSRTVFPSGNEYELLREELRILGHDPVFESALQAAVQEPGQ